MRRGGGGVSFNGQNSVGYGGGKDGCKGVLNSFDTEVIKVKNIIGRLSSWCTVLPNLQVVNGTKERVAEW